MEDKEKSDLEKIKRQFLEEFRSGKPTFGKDGALGPVLKHFSNTPAGGPDLLRGSL